MTNDLAQFRDEYDRFRKMIPYGISLSYWDPTRVYASAKIHLMAICRVLSSMHESIPASIPEEYLPTSEISLSDLHDHGTPVEKDIAGFAIANILSAPRLSSLAEQLLVLIFTQERASQHQSLPEQQPDVRDSLDPLTRFRRRLFG